MDLSTVVIFLVIGAAAGWFAGKNMKDGGFGPSGNIVIGAIGGIVGGYLFRLLVFAVGSLIGSMVTAVAGAVALLFIVRLYNKPKKSSEPSDY
jgi:uncharacterized membrane protein YeaQ/YmgE (transglycosylase-associated protein family)